MRSTAIQYVGLDVHQATVVCNVRDENGHTTVESKIATRADAIRGFLKGLEGRVHVAFEEGTQAQWLFDLVRPLVEEVVVCDPRRIVTKGNKADRIDAARISELLRLGALTPVFHRNSGTRTLKELVRLYEGLVDDCTRVMLRIRALYRGRALGTTSRAIYQPSKRAAWIEQITDEGGRFRADRLYEELDALSAVRRRAKAKMIAEAGRHRAFTLLRSVPGVGPVRAAELIAVIGDPNRFRTKRQLWPYAGLAVVTRTSGEWITETTTGRIVRSSKRPLTRGLNQNCNHLLKKIFKGAAHEAAAKDSDFRAFCGGLVARGTRPELARLTIARKIAAICLMIWKKEVPYDPRHLNNTQPV